MNSILSWLVSWFVTTPVVMIRINGKEHKLKQKIIVPAEVCLLAGQRLGSTITWQKPDGTSGMLAPLETLTLVDGMILNCYFTG